jgi:hypothetical protein
MNCSQNIDQLGPGEFLCKDSQCIIRGGTIKMSWYLEFVWSLFEFWILDTSLCLIWSHFSSCCGVWHFKKNKKEKVAFCFFQPCFFYIIQYTNTNIFQLSFRSQWFHTHWRSGEVVRTIRNHLSWKCHLVSIKCVLFML